MKPVGRQQNLALIRLEQGFLKRHTPVSWIRTVSHQGALPEPRKGLAGKIPLWLCVPFPRQPRVLLEKGHNLQLGSQVQHC